MLAIAFLFKKKLQNYQLCHGLFQSVCDGRNRIVLMHGIRDGHCSSGIRTEEK